MCAIYPLYIVPDAHSHILSILLCARRKLKRRPVQPTPEQIAEKEKEGDAAAADLRKEEEEKEQDKK